MSETSETIQCPCGTVIDNPDNYKVLYLKHEMKEIDVLCPNDACYLRELGYIRFNLEKRKAAFREASFYPPFVTWNSGRLGFDKTEKMLKQHLGEIVKKIDWARIAKETKE